MGRGHQRRDRPVTVRGHIGKGLFLAAGIAMAAPSVGRDCAEQSSAQISEHTAEQGQVIELADGVYLRLGQTAVAFEAEHIANIGFVVGERCVAVIDTGGSLSEGEQLKCAIESVTELPICYVINTHVHPDHMLGNPAFVGPGVKFLGHHKLPRAIALRGELYLLRVEEYLGNRAGQRPLPVPEQTVTSMVQLDIGGRSLEVRAYQSAHTDHDVTVLDSTTGTIFLGDLVFAEHLPVLDGSINGWLTQLEALAELPYQCVVPGHGPVSSRWPEAAQATQAYLRELRQQVRAWIAAGDDLSSAQTGIKPTDTTQWRLVDQYQQRNVAAAFAELEWEE